MPPTVQQKWLNELFKKIEDMPDEVYQQPENAVRVSMAISLKRIADALEKLMEEAP
jgi:hypothetical protein